MTAETFEKVEIQGVVFPTQWDRRGRIIQMAIQTDGFEKYLVDEEHNDTLIHMIDEKILVHGVIIGEDIQGQKVIKIVDVYRNVHKNEENYNESQ